MSEKSCLNCRFQNNSCGTDPCESCMGKSLWLMGLTIGRLIDVAHMNAVDKGFWDKPREFGTMIALIHSELSEALEADRHGDREHLREELADVAIRLGDLCGGLGIDLESAILAKMEKNRLRPRLHGKEY